ncbi:hypothetical protein [Burkholderia sp. S-53]|uniref:hypothetical protein n=1 Tax=Burkholderia sp. S-53 TaxID=2906514 RepID=UPI0021D03659|nr:hypothetical protein [Burkholderia sp. S-53]UXU85287.1 hypothetical protein LXM88_02645 [Burkholderia sp. S-53]
MLQVGWNLWPVLSAWLSLLHKFSVWKKRRSTIRLVLKLASRMGHEESFRFYFAIGRHADFIQGLRVSAGHHQLCDLIVLPLSIQCFLSHIALRIVIDKLPQADGAAQTSIEHSGDSPAGTAKNCRRDWNPVVAYT